MTNQAMNGASTPMEIPFAPGSRLMLEALDRRILVLDGATGTWIQSRGLKPEDYRPAGFDALPAQYGNHDILCLSRPDVITAMHEAYLEAGADILSTNTFNANCVSQADYGATALVGRINRAAAELACAAARQWERMHPGRRIFTAGSIGPTNRTLSLSRDVDDPAARAIEFDALEEDYAEQIGALLDGGVDALLIETVFDTLNARAAIHAADRICEARGAAVPVFVSGTVTDKSGRTLSGQTVEAFAASIRNRLVVSAGLNCSFGARELIPHVERLAAATPLLVSVHPNAGLPDAFGNYVETPEETAALVSRLIDGGCVNVVGGCCGTTPEHIRALAEAAAGKAARMPSVPSADLLLAGLEPVRVSREINFFNIGERTNVAGSIRFARLIREKKYAEALSVARDQVENGAQMIDVNLDDGLLDVKAEMVHFLRLIASEPDISRVPVMVDSSDWEVLLAGIKAIQGKGVANSISLKSGEAVFLSQAAELRSLGAAAVFMAFDEKGQADTFERKRDICARMYRLLVERVGFPAQDIIFDPNILAVATGMPEHDGYGLDFIRAVRWIKENLPHARVSGGVSNLSFSFRGNNRIREAMHAVFLYHAVQAGMDMGIVNPGMLQPYDEVEPELRGLCEDVVLCRTPEASRRLLEWAERMQQEGSEDAAAGGATSQTVAAAWRSLPAEQRTLHALVKGLDEYIQEDVLEALPGHPTAVAFIENVLMDGMKQVGDLFAEGRMFLPQVIRSARVMKRAVAALLPFIERENAGKGTGGAGRILLATVAGDVHDIGKNIVGVVLSCNNFEIRDLGVMVPHEDIVRAAIEWDADIVGVSGLITPSLEQMRRLAAHMAGSGLKIPLLIGGAATSKAHTALRLMPEYGAGVVHCLDASKSAEVASILMDDARRPRFLTDLTAEYLDLAGRVSRLAPETIPIERARSSRPEGVWSPEDVCVPRRPGVTVIEDMTVDDLRPWISWPFFLKAWDLAATEEALEKSPAKREEAERLMRDAQAMLDQLAREERFRIKGVAGLFPAIARDEDVLLFATDPSADGGSDPGRPAFSRTAEPNASTATVDPIATFHFPRQTDARLAEHLSLADFIAPEKAGVHDWMGLFAVTAGLGADELADRLKADGDDYGAILLRILCDRLAEAFAELLHYRVRRELWGYAPDEALPMADILKEKYRGIRPAPGYPAIPDHSLKRGIWQVLGVENRIGMTLTESDMMVPAASVSGFYLSSRTARYFDARRGE